MPAPFIRQYSSSDDSDDSEQGEGECDPFSDRTPNGTATPTVGPTTHPSCAVGPKPGAFEPRVVIGDGLADTNWFSIEGDERKSLEKSEASMSEYLSADELDAAASDEPTPRPSETSNGSCPLAVSINCPPSPYGPQSPAEGPRTPSARTPGSRDALSSLISSSDLEFDVDTEEDRGVSQFQYQGFPLEPQAEVYTRQYVNYLYDAPVSSRSHATNKSGLSEFTQLTEKAR